VSTGTDTQQVADALYLRVARLGRLNARLVGLPGVSIAQLRALASIRDAGSMRINALGERENLSQPSTTLIVGRLEQRGWVTRRPDPADRRAVLLTITPAGRRTLDEARARARAAYEERLARLDSADRAAIAAAIPALDRVLDPP
jgi:DNA-binding MarR family transcriptional regulator